MSSIAALLATVGFLMAMSLSFRLSIMAGTYYAGFAFAALSTAAAYYVYRRYRGQKGAEYLPLLLVGPCAVICMFYLGAAIVGQAPPTSL